MPVGTLLNFLLPLVLLAGKCAGITTRDCVSVKGLTTDNYTTNTQQLQAALDKP